jgi:hypothetical protein
MLRYCTECIQTLHIRICIHIEVDTTASVGEEPDGIQTCVDRVTELESWPFAVKTVFASIHVNVLGHRSMMDVDNAWLLVMLQRKVIQGLQSIYSRHCARRYC